MKPLKPRPKPTGNNELTPGQIKDIGKDNFYPIESKRNIGPLELSEIKEWFDDSLNNPYAIQKGYGRHAFRSTGKRTSTSYIFYFSSKEDLAYFKLLHPDIVN